ncbi:undecaprenyl-diphosphate phosphatase [Dactylosporangium sp. CA-092794]|uniref:undecaprenyl-diphosphate phosphatase n=1 Tax=Dactylosporangium sp. CA-092794 TaxID=3239929 RepID=UPI003D92C2C8
MRLLTYPEAIVVGLLQGVTELFPVSSLGHSVLLPALIGGRWARDLSVSAPESPYLAFVVGLHVATALALLLFFWRDWVRILGGFVSSVRYRRIVTPEERLAWMIVLATIPVGISGLLLEHTFRTVLGRPAPAAAFLVLNGLILFGAERLRRRAARDAHVRAAVAAAIDGAGGVYRGRSVPDRTQGDPDERLASGTLSRAVQIGSAQILALLPGISRSGATMGAGLLKGLSHEDAARFSFLLATPVILAAGVLKLPDLFGPLGAGIHGQVLAGSVASFAAAYLAVRFLTRYFEHRTLTPFAIYSVAAGLAGLAWLTLR